MNDLHPGPDSSDGRVIDQSHYIKKSDRIDRIIECAQCGWNVDLSKRAQGDSLGAIGNPTIKTSTFTPPRGALQTDTYGDPVDTNSGCPFCNSLNPKGNGRDSDPWVTNTRNVENL